MPSTGEMNRIDRLRQFLRRATQRQTAPHPEATATFGYPCQTCGEYHEGLPASVGSTRWSTWVSLSAQSFTTDRDTYEAEGREQQEPFFGWLTAVPPPFPDALLNTTVYLRPVPTRPCIDLELTDHPLAIAQKEGISPAKVQEIAERLLHGDPTA
jgi:hypothetical protein